MTRRRLLLLILSFAVSALFLWLVLHQLDLSEVAAVVGGATFGWIIGAVGLFALGYGCRIQRWRIMLQDARPALGFGRAAVPFLASIATNNVLPFRAGDALRTFAFRNWLGIGAPVVLATLIVERLLDMLSLLLAFGLVLMLFQQDPTLAKDIIGVGANTLLFGALVLAVVLLRPQMFAGLTRWLTAVIGRMAPAIAARLSAVTQEIFTTLEHQARGARMLRLILWSLLAWGCEGAVFYATARGLPALTDAAAAWLAFPVATLATLIPAMPGHVGTFDFFASRAMELMGNPATAAAAFALLVHFILWITATLAGGICLLIWIVRGDPGPNPAGKEFSQ